MNVRLPVRKAILERRTYEPPGEGRADKLRLDFNENTAGCSPAAKLALAKLSPKLLAMYPEYERGTRRLARHFRVKPDELLLTNGGDDALRLFFDDGHNTGLYSWSVLYQLGKDRAANWARYQERCAEAQLAAGPDSTRR